MPGNHVRRWNGDILLFFCRFLPLPSTSLESDSGPEGSHKQERGDGERGGHSDSELNAMALTLWPSVARAASVGGRAQRCQSPLRLLQGYAGPLHAGELHGRTRFQAAGAAAGDGISARAAIGRPGGFTLPGADIPPRWWELFRSRHLNDLIEMGIAPQRRPAGRRGRRAGGAGQRAGAARARCSRRSRPTGIPRASSSRLATLDLRRRHGRVGLLPAHRAGDRRPTCSTCGAARAVRSSRWRRWPRRRPSSAKASISRSPPTSRSPPSRRRRCADRSRRPAG